MPTPPAPAALWVLFSGNKPSFDSTAIAAALDEDAAVEGRDGLFSVTTEGRSLRVLSTGVPLPKELVDQCLLVAHLRPDQKAELAAHATHALVVHEGDEPPGPGGLVALYRTAWALRGGSMLGVMNPASWMCLTTDMLRETMKPDFVDAVRTSPVESLALWLGFVKFFKPDGSTWLTTRGGWLVGLPDLAWLAKSPDEIDAVHSMFASILDYAFTSGTQLVPGHSIDFAERALRIREPYEYVEAIGEDTLVLEPREALP